jgi:HTH-type transcriptional regulator/antitoxin HigA
MRHYPTLDEVEEQYFRDHPEEVEPYLSEIFEEYASTGDSAALLSSLRVIARVRGVSQLAEKTGMTRQGLQKALSEKGNPRLDSINSIMGALGYRLTPQKRDMAEERVL